MIGFILNMPDALALFVLGTGMFLVTLVIRRVIDATERASEKVEEVGVETR